MNRVRGYTQSEGKGLFFSSRRQKGENRSLIGTQRMEAGKGRGRNAPVTAAVKAISAYLAGASFRCLVNLHSLHRL